MINFDHLFIHEIELFEQVNIYDREFVYVYLVS